MEAVARSEKGNLKEGMRLVSWENMATVCSDKNRGLRVAPKGGE